MLSYPTMMMCRLVATLCVLLSSHVFIHGYSPSVLPQRASGFVGRDVYHSSPSSTNCNNVNGARANLTMKKGKANVSPQMRQQYKRAQEMENYRKQMMDSQNAGSDGLPVFNLFVRTSLKNVSYLLLFEQKAEMAYFSYYFHHSHLSYALISLTFPTNY